MRVYADYDTEKAQFSYSVNGAAFVKLGEEFTMVYQMRTFQGVRYCLFNYNEKGKEGGYADFDNYRVEEPHPGGFYRPIPYGAVVRFKNKADDSCLSVSDNVAFKVVDKGLGRVSLETLKGEYVSVGSSGLVGLAKDGAGINETFQWIELERGDLVLLSLSTHRYLNVDGQGRVNALAAVPSPTRKDGTSFIWEQIVIN